MIELLIATIMKTPPKINIKIVQKPRIVIAREIKRETLKEYAERRCNEVFGQGHYPALNNIVTSESGWNPNAKNKSSGACGLGQANPCSKGIKAYPDYLENPQSQVEWQLTYIKNRYGTPANAWRFWQKNRWY